MPLFLISNNMYNVDTVVDSWRTLIGWRQNHDQSGEMLDTDLLTSQSGMLYQDEHGLLTLQNISTIMPDFSLVTYPAWNIATPYVVNQIVVLNNINYICITANTGESPDAIGSTFWRLYRPLNQFLRDKVKAAIEETIINFLETKQMMKSLKSILTNKTIFDSIGRINNTISNTNRRAGFSIVQTRSQGITLRIDRISLQFSVVGNVLIELHHSSRETVIQSTTMAYTQANSAQWFALNWELSHNSDDYDSGGEFYLTYKQSELPAGSQAINKSHSLFYNYIDGSGCSGCAKSAEVTTWKIYGKYVEFHPMSAPEIAGTNLWNIDNNSYDYSNNYGLNFEISLYCDYTHFFVQQRDLFKSALRKQLAINILREIAYNPNSRISQKTTRATAEQILYEIDGDTRGRDGNSLAKKYKNALEAITLNTENLNRVCMPCKQRGVRYRFR